MMSRMIRYTMISVFGLALAGNGAFAQETPEEGGAEGGTEEGGGEGTPTEGGGEATPAETGGGETMAEGEAGGKPPMILPKGKIGVHVAVHVGLSKDFTGKPITIEPDVWYGVMPKLEAGVAHSSYGLAGWWNAPGTLIPGGGGICVAGKKDFGGGIEVDACGGKVYNGPIGILAHYLVAEGNLDLAADGGLVIRVLDPMMIGIKAGVQGRWMSGKIMVNFAPNIYIGATKRDEGNKESLNVPVSVGYAVSPKLMAGVQTGIAGPLDGFGDGYAIPLEFGAMFALNPNMSVGGAFSLGRVAGFEGPGAADIRTLGVFLMWHN